MGPIELQDKLNTMFDKLLVKRTKKTLKKGLKIINLKIQYKRTPWGSEGKMKIESTNTDWE